MKARPALPEEDKPRLSIPKPLTRTSSLMPGAKPAESKGLFGAGNLSLGLGPPAMASTPAVKQDAPKIVQKPLSAPKIEPKIEKSPPADITVIKASVKSEPVSAFSKKDLLDLINNFDDELENYKTENSKLDLSFFSEEARKENVTKINGLQNYSIAIKKV